MAGEQDDSTPEREDLSQLELPTLFRRGRKAKDAAGPAAEPAVEPGPEQMADSTPAPDPAEESPAPAQSPASAAPEEHAVVEPAPVEEPPTAAPDPDEAEATRATPVRRRGLWRRRDTGPASSSEPVVDEPAAAPDEPTVDEQPPSASEAPAKTSQHDALADQPDAELTAPIRAAPTAHVEPTVVEQRPSASDDAPAETPTTARLPLEDGVDRWEPSARQAPPVAEQPVEPEPTAAAGPSRAQRLGDVRLPPIAGQLAAAITGTVVGLVGVGLVVLSERGCQAVRGASSCGSAGLFLILAVAALMVVLGALALSAWRQDAALSTSFMGVGLLAVLVMLFLLPVVFRWFMVLVMPVLGAGTFTLSWWVSNRMGPEARKVNDEYSRPIHR